MAKGSSKAADGQQAYYGVRNAQTKKRYLPDGVSFIAVRKMGHGEENEYLNETMRRVTINDSDGTTKTEMKLGAGDAQMLLYKMAVCEWNLIDGDGQHVDLMPHTIAEFFKSCDDQEFIRGINEDIVELNPWLELQQSLDDLRKQRKRIDKLIAKAEEEEAKKAS